MKILVTGGNGYLGSRVVKELINKGHKVVLLIIEGHNTKEYENESNIEVYSTTIEDIEKAMKSGIDCVLHLATLYGRGKEKNIEVIESNLVFPLTVLESAINNNVKYFFNMDTAIHKLINPYTVSKRHFRDWGKYYSNQKAIKFINIKSEHFYGPFDKDVKFIANMLKQFKENKEYIETTLGEQKRAFIYIDDLIDAIMCIINYEMKNDDSIYVEYDVGPDSNITIKEVLNIMKKATNSKSIIKFGAIPYRINEEMESNCDNSKLKSIGWKQKVLTFEEGIKRIIEIESK